MGYGMDEHWEADDDERQLDPDELRAIACFEMDEGEWHEIGDFERKRLIRLSKLMSGGE